MLTTIARPYGLATGASRSLAILAASVALLVPPARGATYKVGTDASADFPTITAALAVVVAGDSVLVSELGSPYQERITLVGGVVYQGAWNSDFTDQNGLLYETIVEPPAGDPGTVVNCGTAGSATLFAAFTIQGGNDSGSGGGIFAGPGTSLSIRNCLIRNNHAAVGGGGLKIGANSGVVVYNCRFEDNTAGRIGGGISIAASAVAAEVDSCTIVRCSVTGTATTHGGGGLHVAAPLAITKMTIRDCVSGNDGGGILVDNTSPDFGPMWLGGNIAVRNGGGIAAWNGSGRIWGTAVDTCLAGGSGGAISFEGGSYDVDRCYLRGNSAIARGGGIYFDRSTDALLDRTEVFGNQAATGGGIAIQGTPAFRFTSVEIRQCSIVQNASTNPGAAGGGIHVFGEFLGPFVNNVITDSDGYGIWCVGILAQPNIRYNCVWNDDGLGPDTEYGGSCADRTGINGNIEADPRFCDPDSSPPDLVLTGNSPCVRAGESGEDLGAHPGAPACGSVSIQAATWGSIKARYR